MSGMIEELMAQLDKEIGKNSGAQKVENWINTGYPPLNKIMSGKYDGGLPFGRMIEIYGASGSGKTAIATQCMINAQKLGGVAIFIDWERSFDVDMAVAMGLNPERPYWIYDKAKTWEAGNMLAAKACKLIRQSKAIPDTAPILVVFDSIAAAIPQSSSEKEIDALTMNDTSALARVTSTTLKYQAQFAEEYNSTLLYLNQIRDKIGVVFGNPQCLRGDVTVPFVDGTSDSMENIVKNKIQKQVWSLNEKTGEIEPKNIVNWFDNGGSDKKWVNIRTEGSGTKNGVIGGTFTEDHLILTAKDGWKRAADISIGDKLVSKQLLKFKSDAREFLIGVLNFDATMMSRGRKDNSGSTRSIIICDNNNLDYARWKVEKLSRHLRFTEHKFTNTNNSKRKGETFYKYSSEWCSELKNYKDFARNPVHSFQNGMTDVQLALMIMDDGTLCSRGAGAFSYYFSAKRLAGDVESIDLLCDIFGKMGLANKPNYGNGSFSFTSEASATIAKRISAFVPDCMQYKLPEKYQGLYVDFQISEPVVHYEQIEAEVWHVENVTVSRRSKMSSAYDIAVEDNHNYMVGNTSNGFIVHNCTPGGKAMEYYSTVRLQISRKTLLDKTSEDGGMTGQNITIKCTKSKMTAPFKTCELLLSFDETGRADFDMVTSLIDYLAEKELIESSGARISWEGKNLYKKEVAKKIHESGEYKKLVAMLKD